MSIGDSVFLYALGGNETAVRVWLNEKENQSNASITRMLYGLAKYGHSEACLKVFQQLIKAVDFTAMRGSSSEGLHVVTLKAVFTTACRHGNIRIVDFLISDYNCDIRKALNVASIRGQEKLVDRLLSDAYEVNDPHKQKWRLTLACALNDKKGIKDLFKYHSFIDRSLVFPLVAACFHGKMEAMTILLDYINTELEQYEIINRTSPAYTLHGRITPLMAACIGCHTKIVKTIFELVPDVDVRCCTEKYSGSEIDDRSPFTGGDNVLHVVIMTTFMPPLNEACYKGDVERVKHLLTDEGVLTAQDYRGNTPLHLACQQGHTEIVRVLLAGFADKDVTNNWLQTPAGVAKLWGNNYLLPILDTMITDNSNLNDLIVQNKRANTRARNLNQNASSSRSTQRDTTRVLYELNPDAAEFQPAYGKSYVPYELSPNDNDFQPLHEATLVLHEPNSNDFEFQPLNEEIRVPYKLNPNAVEFHPSHEASGVLYEPNSTDFEYQNE